MGLLLIATGIVSAVALRQRGTSAAPTGASTASSVPPVSSASPVAPPAPPDGVASAREFDPQGDPPNEENTDEVRYAIDGKSETRWRTVHYNNDPDLGGIKRGVGLVLDLGSTPTGPSTVQVRLSGNGTDLQARIPKTDPAGTAKPPMSTDARWRTVSKRSQAGSTATLRLEEPATTRFVLVYLTSLPRREAATEAESTRSRCCRWPKAGTRKRPAPADLADPSPPPRALSHSRLEGPAPNRPRTRRGSPAAAIPTPSRRWSAGIATASGAWRCA